MFPQLYFCNPNLCKNSGFVSTFCSTILISSPTNLVFGYMSRCHILDIASFNVEIASAFSYSSIPSNFFFLTPSSNVLLYIWLYPFLLCCSTFEVLWFLKLYFFLLSYSTRPCFCLFIMAWYFYICWTTTNEI